MNWRSFWEQFEVSNYKKNVEDVENLAYLRDALKDGSARKVIQRLLEMVEKYPKVIKCLQECYNKPQFIHQAYA